MSSTLLARYAECIFWLARYIERAENLARILDVNETFNRDSRGSQNWLSIVQLYANDEAFFAKHAVATVDAVLRFYVTDIENPHSIIASVRNARENARTLRPLISTEMWVQLNMFYNRLKTIDSGDLTLGNLNRLFSWVKEACQTHTGITEGTFYRDEGWYFYQLGRYIERGDETTRLLDIKYHLLLPRIADVGSPIDASQWSALLRSAAGYHAFRRLHATGQLPTRVAGFMLLNRRFPRSVFHCVDEIDSLLTGLRSRYDLRGGNGASEAIDELRALLAGHSIEYILSQGLHEFLDLVQRLLINITSQMNIAFFGHAPPEQVQAQGQIQS
ncbi:MAG TPA: alpha-E domain-containing protein [Stellaceae bacterium]|nr:alpha-E domain-containing protein [Stellaceae bacterium]